MTIQPGLTISHYRVLEPIGAGGMGVIYKAEDLHLERVVALKFLPPGVGADTAEGTRLIQEAKAASALDHPNICTIFGVDQSDEGGMFIVMAYYPGETLRQRVIRGSLSLQDAAGLTIQLCEGLAKAHSRGIIHRDIKPENLILTDDGILKILDFGISRFTGGPGLTRPGTILGTPSYMSPEQVKGEQVDHQSDIWATGILLFHMLTAQHPFSGENELSLMYAIVNNPPRPILHYRPNLPAQVASILDRALAKERESRYQAISEMATDLRGLLQGPTTTGAFSIQAPAVPSPPSGKCSIAVLPFRDLSPQRDQDYLCEGIAEAIINRLGRLPELRVISPSSVFRFQDSGRGLGELATTLDVLNSLDGSIQTSGDQLRVTVRLTDLADSTLIWSDQFSGTLRDVFEFQDRISKRVVEALGSTPTVVSSLRSKPPVTGPSFPAYQHYLEGRHHWNRRTVAGVKRSIQSFTEAIDLDSRFGLAFAGLADAYTVLGMYGAFPPKEVMPRAKDAAQRALETDGSLAEAHVSLGCVQAVFDWDWDEAESSFQKALKLNPNYATAHHWYAVNLLTPLGRFEEAVREMESALHLDPISPAIVTSTGLPHYFAGNLVRAEECYRKALDLDPNFPMAHFFLAQVKAAQSQFDASLEEFRKALDLFGKSSNMLAQFASTAAMGGMTAVADEAAGALQQPGLGYVSPYDLACVASGQGDTSRALSHLEMAVEEKSYLLVYLEHDPILAGIRQHSRFLEISRLIFGSTRSATVNK